MVAENLLGRKTGPRLLRSPVTAATTGALQVRQPRRHCPADLVVPVLLQEVEARRHLQPGSSPGVEAGPAGVKALMARYRQAFPDLRMTIEKYLDPGRHRGDTGCAVPRLTGGGLDSPSITPSR
jgi:hypothetical protein